MLTIDLSLLNHTKYYSVNEKPVFFGHYWLNGTPELYLRNICCLDYSVAQNGYLVAYRFIVKKFFRMRNLSLFRGNIIIISKKILKQSAKNYK